MLITDELRMVKSATSISTLVLLLSLIVCTAPAEADVSGSAWPNIYYQGPSTGKYVALTIDDAPMATTVEMLDILDELGIKATYFISGAFADREPELLREIALRGHELGSHSYSHPNMTEIDDDRLHIEFEWTNSVITEITGIIPHLYRPPGGNYNNHTVEVAYSYELVTVLWTANSADYTGLTPSQIRSRVLGRIGPGGIILVHDGLETTREAVPGIVSTLRERGYTFVTIGQMLEMTHTECPWEIYAEDVIESFDVVAPL